MSSYNASPITNRLAKSISALFVLLCGLTNQATAFDTSAKAAFVIDQTTGTILLSKNADIALPPASMSKLMTLYIAFEAVRDGRLRLEEELPVSKYAMAYGGSTMFLNTTDRVKVEDLLRGIIVLSGNDSCAVIAEALSPTGTESGFASLMNQRAKQLGMAQSNFQNSNGWPAKNHFMSMRDLALLADLLITEFPEFYPMFAENEFLFDGRAKSNIHNRNPLLGLGIGADGLKTGHTDEAGYGIVSSAKQGERRIIFVLSGLDTARDRAEQSEAIINWAFRQFTKHQIAEADSVIASADVWMGAKRQVGLTTGRDLAILRPVFGDQSLVAEVVYQGPIEAPIKRGSVIAQLVLTTKGLPQQYIPLLAAEDVAVGGLFERVVTSARVLIRSITRARSLPKGDL